MFRAMTASYICLTSLMTQTSRDQPVYRSGTCNHRRGCQLRGNWNSCGDPTIGASAAVPIDGGGCEMTTAIVASLGGRLQVEQLDSPMTNLVQLVDGVSGSAQGDQHKSPLYSGTSLPRSVTRDRSRCVGVQPLSAAFSQRQSRRPPDRRDLLHGLRAKVMFANDSDLADIAQRRQTCFTSDGWRPGFMRGVNWSLKPQPETPGSPLAHPICSGTAFAPSMSQRSQPAADQPRHGSAGPGWPSSPAGPAQHV